MVRIYDTRDRSKAQLAIAAHDADVNVISWNALTSYMLASGGDDGALRIWDLRALPTYVANFTFHKQPITSVEWCPQESSMLATCSEVREPPSCRIPKKIQADFAPYAAAECAAILSGLLSSGTV